MAELSDIVNELKTANQKLDDLKSASAEPAGAAAAEDKKDAANAAARTESYLKTIADAVKGKGASGAAGGKQAEESGGMLAGIGGAISKLGIGAGVAMGGLGALFAGGGYLLKQLSDFDGKKVKANIMELIGIGDDLVKKEGSLLKAFGKAGLLIFTLGGIGLGLAAFSVGTGVAAAVTYFTKDIKWSEDIKKNVETLLSINTKTFLQTAGLVATMGTLGAALLAFSAGTAAGAAATGIDKAISMFTGDKKGQGTNWAKSIKDNVEMLLSIKTKGVLETAGIVATLGTLGAGLIAFSIGSATATAATGIDKAISMFVGSKSGQGTGWAEKVKKEVETLLSIKTIGTLDTIKLVATLGGIGLGLIVFSLGKIIASGAGAAAAKFEPSEQERKDGMNKFSKTGWAKTIVAEVTELLKIGELSFFDAAKFVGTMGMVGLGLVAFSLGKVAAGTAGAITDKIQPKEQKDALGKFQEVGWAQKIVNEVTTLLGIAKLPLGDAGNFVKSMGMIGAGLVAFAIGKAASGTAEIVNRFANVGKEKKAKSFAHTIKEEVATLISIIDPTSGIDQAKADTFSSVMGTISKGLLKFSGSTFLSSLANVGSSILNFLSGKKSPIQEMKTIGKEAASLERGAAAIEKIEAALKKIASLKFKGGDIKMKEFAEDLAKSVPAIEAAIMGGTIKGGWFKSNVEYKGLASPDIKFDDAAKNINVIMKALGKETSFDPKASDDKGPAADLAQTRTIQTETLASGAIVPKNKLGKFVKTDPAPVVKEEYTGPTPEEQAKMKELQANINNKHRSATFKRDDRRRLRELRDTIRDRRKVKKRVEGGTLTPGGPYLVGEGGPEIIIPSSTGQIMNAQRTQQMQQASLQKSVGPSGGATVNNTPVTNITTSQSSTTVSATPMTHPSPIINMVNSAA